MKSMYEIQLKQASYYLKIWLYMFEVKKNFNSCFYLEVTVILTIMGITIISAILAN